MTMDVVNVDFNGYDSGSVHVYHKGSEEEDCRCCPGIEATGLNQLANSASHAEDGSALGYFSFYEVVPGAKGGGAFSVNSDNFNGEVQFEYADEPVLKWAVASLHRFLDADEDGMPREFYHLIQIPSIDGEVDENSGDLIFKTDIGNDTAVKVVIHKKKAQPAAGA